MSLCIECGLTSSGSVWKKSEAQFSKRVDKKYPLESQQMCKYVHARVYDLQDLPVILILLYFFLNYFEIIKTFHMQNVTHTKFRSEKEWREIRKIQIFTSNVITVILLPHFLTLTWTWLLKKAAGHFGKRLGESKDNYCDQRELQHVNTSGRCYQHIHQVLWSFLCQQQNFTNTVIC